MNNFERLLNEYIQEKRFWVDRPLTHAEGMECAERAKKENMREYEREALMTITYQANAQDYTARQTADGFARSWFDHPRDIETWEEITGELYHFTLANGAATYQVKYIPGVRLVSFPLWQIARM